jgi:Tn3 transposase DDE domain
VIHNPPLASAGALSNQVSLELCNPGEHRQDHPVRDEDAARLSPLVHEHINVLGRYSFAVPEGERCGRYAIPATARLECLFLPLRPKPRYSGYSRHRRLNELFTASMARVGFTLNYSLSRQDCHRIAEDDVSGFDVMMLLL